MNGIYVVWQCMRALLWCVWYSVGIHKINKNGKLFPKIIYGADFQHANFSSRANLTIVEMTSRVWFVQTLDQWYENGTVKTTTNISSVAVTFIITPFIVDWIKCVWVSVEACNLIFQLNICVVVVWCHTNSKNFYPKLLALKINANICERVKCLSVDFPNSNSAMIFSHFMRIAMMYDVCMWSFWAYTTESKNIATSRVML